MEPDPTLEVPTDKPAGRARKVIVAGVLVAAALAVAFWVHYQRNLREQAAAHSLGELGAIVVMDGAGSHVGSVNLSTIEDPDKLAAALVHLPALVNLTSLDASRTAIKDRQLSAFEKLTGLRSLTLNNTGVSDEGVPKLAGLSNLQALYLVETSVSDACVNSVASLSNLHILDLSATKVTGNLEPVAELPQLEWLLLRGAKLNDDALPKLAACPRLKRLSLEDAKYSPESIAELRKALPGLSVDATSIPPSP
jgi:hypothetical protein